MPRFRRKRSRISCDKVDVTQLCQALEPFARDKGFQLDWEFTGYSKRKRSHGPDREALSQYKPILVELLRCAPSGHPPLNRLRDCWIYLHQKYSVMAWDLQKSGADVRDWACQAGDMAKVCLKHLVDMKVSRTTWVTPDIKEMLDMIHLPATTDADEWSESDLSDRPCTPSALPERQGTKRRLLAKEDSAASSVQFCAAFCRCPECYEPPTVEIADSEDEDASPTSQAAKQQDAHMPAKRGAAKRAIKSRPAANDGSACRLVKRAQPTTAYLMHKGKYLVGCSQRQSSDYLELLELIKNMIDNKELNPDKAECLEQLDSLINR